MRHVGDEGPGVGLHRTKPTDVPFQLRGGFVERARHLGQFAGAADLDSGPQSPFAKQPRRLAELARRDRSTLGAASRIASTRAARPVGQAIFASQATPACSVSRSRTV